MTQKQFDSVWADRTRRYAVSYDDAKAATFATATIPDGFNGHTVDVWYALVDGAVIEGYENGCHHAALVGVYGRRFESAAEAYQALEGQPRLAGLQRA